MGEILALDFAPIWPMAQAFAVSPVVIGLALSVGVLVKTPRDVAISLAGGASYLSRTVAQLLAGLPWAIAGFITGQLFRKSAAAGATNSYERH